MLTRSSKRADAQPKSSCFSVRWPIIEFSGVDCLVNYAAGEAADTQPECRRDDAVGKILGEAFDRRAADGCFIEAFRVAADNLRDSGAAGFQSAGFQRFGNGRDMIFEALLCQQAAGGDSGQDDAERDKSEDAGGGYRNRGREKNDKREGKNAVQLAPGRLEILPVEHLIEPGNKLAYPDHRMADCLQQQPGIAGEAFYQKGEEGEQD